MGEQTGDKTEEPTPHRLKEAREIKARTDKRRASWQTIVAAGFLDLPLYAGSDKTVAVFVKEKE